MAGAKEALLPRRNPSTPLGDAMPTGGTLKVNKRLALGAAAVAALATAMPTFAASHNSGDGKTACADGTVTWTPSTLWAPNHKLQTIDIYYKAPADNPAVPGDQTTITITGITDDQILADGTEMNGSGQPDAMQGPDWNIVKASDEVAEGDTAHVIAQVRAERSGQVQAGRTYKISLMCSESNNATGADLSTGTDSGSAEADVLVPHDQGQN